MINRWEIHIVDFDPSSASAQGCLEDLSMVEKYVMPDEEYGRREGTVRQFKKILEAQGKIEYKKKDVIMEDISEFTEGSRCAVMPGEKRGEIRWNYQKLALLLPQWTSTRPSFRLCTIQLSSVVNIQIHLILILTVSSIL